MVVHDDEEKPIEEPTLKKEVINQNFIVYHSDDYKKVEKRPKSKNEAKTKVKKYQKNKCKDSSISQLSSDNDDKNSCLSKISPEDLLELRTVYKQCKTVIKKIEQKYGHLLDSEESDIDEPSPKRSKLAENIQDSAECTCSIKKKIVFDEDGKEVSIDTLPSNHICPNKMMLHKDHVVRNSDNRNIQIEYHNKNIELSDNIQELRCILQDSSIEMTYRNQVIDKIKAIKQEYNNEIRFHKLALVEKLKSNPDEIFNFNGSNLSSLEGYQIF